MGRRLKKLLELGLEPEAKGVEEHFEKPTEPVESASVFTTAGGAVERPGVVEVSVEERQAAALRAPAAIKAMAVVAPSVRGGAHVTPARLAAVEKELVEMRNPTEICAKFASAWGLSDSKMMSLIKRVYDVWAKQAEAMGPNTGRELARRRFERLARLAEEQGELPTAAICLDRLAKLDGAYAPEKQTVTHEGVIGIAADSPDKIRARIAELSRRMLPAPAEDVIEVEVEELPAPEPVEEGGPEAVQCVDDEK